MNYKVLLLIGVCVKIATSLDCNQQIDLSLNTLHCCFNAWKEMDVLNDECFQITELHHSVECMLDCLYTSHGMLINGTIVVENAKKFIRSFGSEEYQNTFIPAFERCDKFDWDKLNTKFGHLIDNPKGECSPKGAIFDNCVASYVITRCPKHNWEESEYCTAQRNFLNKCIFNS